MSNNIISLSDTNIGDRVKVVEIAGGRKLTNRLMELGIMEGAILDIVNCGGGPLIIKVGNSRFALGQGVAKKIKVEKLGENVSIN